MAARSAPTILGAAVATQTWPARKARCGCRDAAIDLAHGDGQSAVEGSQNSRRTADARHHGIGADCLANSTECSAATTVSDLETFLRNHVGHIASVDFFTVPTVRLRVLFVFLVLEHRRREVLHFNVPDHPTSEWVAQQIVEAFGDREAPRYLDPGSGWRVRRLKFVGGWSR
jgi:hypothetical protein